IFGCRGNQKNTAGSHQMKELYIIKVGGNVIDDEKNLGIFLKKFSAINAPKILVHGGGKLATDLSSKLGIEAKMVDGKRITDGNTLEIVTMVYAGLINKSIVAKLNSLGTNTLGVCGADMGLIPAKKWTDLLDNNICAVVAPITADAKGQLLNTNADTIASSIAQALSKAYKTTLIYCFEKDGVLSNPKDDTSVIREIQMKMYAQLKSEGIISKGMIPKMDNSWEAINKGVAKVVIGNALEVDKLISSTGGTHLSLD